MYRYDVTTREGYEVLRDIRELRLATMAAQATGENPGHREEFAATMRRER
ncbi:hypothetical protein [Sphaerisporangium fuscum]|nr:hypothetical protein [Sphaerisporangium fuscum]